MVWPSTFDRLMKHGRTPSPKHVKNTDLLIKKYSASHIHVRRTIAAYVIIPISPDFEEA